MNDQADSGGSSSEDQILASPQGQSGQMKLKINDSDAATHYSSVARVVGSAEEFTIDFAKGIRPTGQPNESVLKVDARVILNPWAAKRLAITLGQAVHRYEQAYGELEIDARKRAKNPPKGGGPSGGPGSN